MLDRSSGPVTVASPGVPLCFPLPVPPSSHSCRENKNVQWLLVSCERSLLVSPRAVRSSMTQPRQAGIVCPALPLRLLLASVAAALVGAAAAAGAAEGAKLEDTIDELGEPWGASARRARATRLEAVASSLRQVRAAEVRAARHEKQLGSSKLDEADRATQEAARFTAKADKLLSSERALRQEQAAVERRLDALEAGHVNVRPWRECQGRSDGGGADCQAGESADEWESEQGAAVGGGGRRGSRSHASSAALQRLRQHTARIQALRRKRKRHASKRTKHSGGASKRSGDATNTGARSFATDTADPLRAHGPSRGYPYGNKQLSDSNPTVNWKELKTGALKAGYDLSNCFVAAAEFPSQVTVKIMKTQTVPVQKTERGCTCKSQWKYRRETQVVDEKIVEEDHSHTYEGCSMNGSNKKWCATDQDSCGIVSTDAHAGYGQGRYGWTRFDYCSGAPTTDSRHVALYQSKHSGGAVSCLADFFIKSDRALEWRALDLVRQGATTQDHTNMLPPAELASRYEQCIMRADVGGSAVFCEADMLRHLAPGVVRHALLISRADSTHVRWANRQRVTILFTKQMQRCLSGATDVGVGIVCMSQMMSSLPYKVAHRAFINAMDATESGEAPQEVDSLGDKLSRCVRAASDDDALGFCMATFLAHVPRKTVLAVKRMALRVRAFGTAGFVDTNGNGGSGTSEGVEQRQHAGWVGLEDAKTQAGSNKHLWTQGSRGRY